jgi:hypothetical protein
MCLHSHTSTQVGSWLAGWLAGWLGSVPVVIDALMR